MARLVRQMLNTPIKIRVALAFARVSVDLVDSNGEDATVELDMESTIQVLEPMDAGPMAVAHLQGQVLAQKPEVTVAQTNQSFWLAIVAFGVACAAFGATLRGVL